MGKKKSAELVVVDIIGVAVGAGVASSSTTTEARARVLFPGLVLDLIAGSVRAVLAAVDPSLATAIGN